MDKFYKLKDWIIAICILICMVGFVSNALRNSKQNTQTEVSVAESYSQETQKDSTNKSFVSDSAKNDTEEQENSESEETSDKGTSDTVTMSDEEYKELQKLHRLVLALSVLLNCILFVSMLNDFGGYY